MTSDSRYVREGIVAVPHLRLSFGDRGDSVSLAAVRKT